MNSDSRFENRLLSALLSEHAALTARDDAEVAPLRASRSRSWQLRNTWLAVTAASVAVAATGTFVYRSPAKPAMPAPAHVRQTPSAEGGSPIDLPGHVDAAYVVARTLKASEIDDAVVHEVVQAPDVATGARTVHELWSQNGNATSLDRTLDAAGRPVSAILLDRGDVATTATIIDYSSHTYTTTRYAPAPSGGPAPAPARLSLSAKRLRAAVAGGHEVLKGPATIDGKRAIELVSRDSSATVTLYVDPETYLPVREVDTSSGGGATGNFSIVTDTDYEENTPANRALLTVQGAVPPGFTRTGG